ncbi:MAG: TlpA disulfide reductase family protein [Phycisphaerales bacterium]|nr:TlpA disulfide reductase family protein [Phycisphaerales bacterium]
MIIAATLVLTAGLTATLSSAPDETIRLTPVAKGASAKLGGYTPQKTTFTGEKPGGVTKVPEGLTAPAYGTINIGEGGVHFVIDEPDGKPATLSIDANRNGDLTDDAPVEWKGRITKGKDGKPDTTMYNGSAVIDIGEKDKPFMASISMYRFDRNDPSRAALKSTLLYYNDYAYQGEVNLGGTGYKVMLNDAMAKGDFRGAPLAAGAPESASSGVSLLIDVNGNGKFDSRGERFDIARPFNIGGTTYEVSGMARDGSAFKIVKSSQTVAEIAPPPDHGVGKQITAFEATDTAGKTVKFPGDYTGKIVLIDFWATWCGPCMKEMPSVVKAYQNHHAKGFEILGISLDSDKSITKMPEVMEKSGMTWRQIADGKYWKAEIAQKYGVNSIPATLLVDGTTGKILGANLRGEALDKAIEKALDRSN